MSTVMETASLSHYFLLGELLAYPGERYTAQVATCRDALRDLYPQAAAHVAHFYAAVAKLSVGAQEELYTRTFDMAPACVPYVSVHLFGDASHKRGMLMVRLREAFQRIGLETGPELPDHIGFLLSALPSLSADERSELVQHCLREPLTKMSEQLETSNNPFSWLLRAVSSVLDADCTKGERQ